MKNKAVHSIVAAACSVLAVIQVEKIDAAELIDLGMPENLWINCVKKFGLLIISIDT